MAKRTPNSLAPLAQVAQFQQQVQQKTSQRKLAQFHQQFQSLLLCDRSLTPKKGGSSQTTVSLPQKKVAATASSKQTISSLNRSSKVARQLAASNKQTVASLNRSLKVLC